MLKTYLFLSMCYLGGIAYSQTEDTKTIFSQAQSGQTETVSFTTTKLDENDLGQLKDDLLMFPEKVLVVDINEIDHIFSLTYNEHMLIGDLIQVFKKNRINYMKSWGTMESSSPTQTKQ